MAIVAVTLEFRELLGGWFALFAFGPDGRELNNWQHPAATRSDPAQMLRYYTAVAGTGLLAGVTPEAMAKELVAFRPAEFSEAAGVRRSVSGIVTIHTSPHGLSFEIEAGDASGLPGRPMYGVAPHHFGGQEVHGMRYRVTFEEVANV